MTLWTLVGMTCLVLVSAVSLLTMFALVIDWILEKLKERRREDGA